MSTKLLTIMIQVPVDYDLDPLVHRIEENLDAIINGSSETDAVVEDDVRCPSLTFRMDIKPS